MKCFKRNELYSEIRDPQPSYFLMQGTFWEYVRYYLSASLAIPWYAYIVFAAIFLGILIAGEWLVALIVLGFFALFIFGVALYTAFSYRKMAEVGAYVGLDENGVGYWVPAAANEDESEADKDEEEDIRINLAISSPWYELDEIKVFDSFLLFKFVSTSQLRLVFVSVESIEYAGMNVDEAVENILAFWKQYAHDKPVDQKDRRFLWIIIVIGIIALRFILKYLKHGNF